MRDIRVIEAEISKLQAELEDAKADVSKKIAAVHILQNLGWSWTRGAGWKRPEPKVRFFDARTPSHIKAGDYCLLDSTLPLSFVYVRKISGETAVVSRVLGCIGPHINVQMKTMEVDLARLVVVSAEDIKAHSLSK